MKSHLLAAGILTGALCAAPGAAHAAPAPSPTPTPTPTPTPPPHAASCADGSTSPYVLYGSFPHSTVPNTSVNTTIQIVPDTADGRSYIAQQEAHVRQEQAALSTTGMATLTRSSDAQGTTAAQSLSALVGRLGSQVENTTTDAAGNWACQGITFQTPYLLWVSMAIATTTSVTPPPLAGALGSIATQRTHTTQIYYTAQLTASDISTWFAQRLTHRNSIGNINWFEIPFSRWTQVAQVAQPG